MKTQNPLGPDRDSQYELKIKHYVIYMYVSLGASLWDLPEGPVRCRASQRRHCYKDPAQAGIPYMS